MVELHVSRNGSEELVYTFQSVKEAADHIHFLSEFWGDALFVLQPVRH